MAADEAVVFDTLTLAFSGDPPSRWVWPDPRTYLDAFPRFAKVFGGEAFAHGSAYRIGSAGAALWLPPEVGPDEKALGELIERTVPQAMQADVGALFEEMGSYHPTEPHWYLPLIGVDPARHRKGYGAALLQDTLRRCDRDHVAAYFESTNVLNIPLYERHGFEILATIQVGSSPPIYPMLRRPRS